MSELDARAGWKGPVGRVLGVLIVLGAVATGIWAWRLTYVDPRTDDASRYGSTPMSARRVTALTASLVCKVARTRCPVRLA